MNPTKQTDHARPFAIRCLSCGYRTEQTLAPAQLFRFGKCPKCNRRHMLAKRVAHREQRTAE